MKTFFHLANSILAFMVTILFAPTPVKAGECGRLCETEFWKVATPADVQAEVASGSDPQVRGELGLTPLHMAVANNRNPTVVKALLAESGSRDHVVGSGAN